MDEKICKEQILDEYYSYLNALYKVSLDDSIYIDTNDAKQKLQQAYTTCCTKDLQECGRILSKILLDDYEKKQQIEILTDVGDFRLKNTMLEKIIKTIRN